MFELSELRLVRELATHSSMVRASRVLGVSPSAVTRALAALEAKMGCVLFDRSRRGLQVTNECRIVLAEANEILRRSELLQSKVIEMRGHQTEELLVSCGGYALETILSAAAAKLAPSNPDLRLRVVTGHVPLLIREVLERRVDAALVETAELENMEDFHIHPLRRHPIFLVVRPGHPLLKERGSLSLATILRYPLVTPGITTHRTAGPLSEARGQAVALPRCHRAFPAIIMDTMSAAVDVAAGSDVVAAATAPVTELNVRCGRIEILPFHADWLCTNFGLLTLTRRPQPPVYAALVQLLEQVDEDAFEKARGLCATAVEVLGDTRSVASPKLDFGHHAAWQMA